MKRYSSRRYETNNGKRRSFVAWSLLDQVVERQLGENSRRPIKSPAGLDLSTNGQLLTFKVDEEGREGGMRARVSR